LADIVDPIRLLPVDLADDLGVCVGHVHGYGLQGDLGSLEALQKGDPGRGILTFVGTADLPGLQVQHNRPVAVRLVGSELIHREVVDLPERPPAMELSQVGFEHVLHQVPAHPQVKGHVVHGRDTAQVHDEPTRGAQELNLAISVRIGFPAPGTTVGADLDLPMEDHLLPFETHRKA
jgi:hypothetical protein